jgi:uncharacterized protein YbaP (TraB family)
MLCGFLIISLTSTISIGGLSAPAQVRATEKPFLWRIDGNPPSYLYGTVHVPDPRVLALPEVVRLAFEASAVFNAEIPLDAGTQASIMDKVLLPKGQDLRSIVGEQVFARLLRVMGKILGDKAPPGMVDVMAMTLRPMKPWAVMSQVELLEFLPDLTAGREPLDAMLYSMAAKAGKELGGLETVEEQVAVFDAFSNEEQVKMLISTLDDLEEDRPAGSSAMQEIVDLYLTGDLNQLAKEVNEQYPKDEDLNKKLLARLVDDRNLRMAERIAVLCQKKPGRSYFFAVGAMHYAGDTGIINQLTKRGFKITRLGPNDAASIVRKPAA